MSSILRGLAAEITPEWMKPKSVDAAPDPREEPDDQPMPAPTWEPEVEKTPLDPKENEDEFDKDRDDVEPSDPRHGFTPKPG